MRNRYARCALALAALFTASMLCAGGYLWASSGPLLAATPPPRVVHTTSLPMCALLRIRVSAVDSKAQANDPNFAWPDVAAWDWFYQALDMRMGDPEPSDGVKPTPAQIRAAAEDVIRCAPAVKR